VCAVLAILAGAWRSLARTTERTPITNGLIARATICAAIAITAVIAIDLITR